jgi:sporulation protein YlmC with PRC-barrel domain
LDHDCEIACVNSKEANMKKHSTLLTATAMALAFAPFIIDPAFAQSQSRSEVVGQDHSMRTSKLIGMEVYNEKGEDIGKLEDILVKTSPSEPQAILSVGTFTGGAPKLVAVPLSHISLKADKASMAATQPQMEAMPTWQFRGLQGGNEGGNG